ncbi:hypothetical protein RIF29_05182 [Crotalaria pallida]|uniref:Uncharacterized protein n=1 Tax=Crotalaria pallida TaxID=3830 RepID=A0AAN9J2S7_CROPI
MVSGSQRFCQYQFGLTSSSIDTTPGNGADLLGPAIINKACQHASLGLLVACVIQPKGIGGAENKLHTSSDVVPSFNSHLHSDPFFRQVDWF